MSKNDLDLFLSMLARYKSGGSIHGGHGNSEYNRLKRLASKVANHSPQYVLVLKKNWENELDDFFQFGKSMKRGKG